jgi:hypothetical protein
MSVRSARNQSSIDAVGLKSPHVRCQPGLKSWNSALPSVVGSPRSWVKSRDGAAPTSGVNSVMIDSDPWSSMASSIPSAMSPSASSQETSSNFPSPRSPTRFSGFVTRSGE